jgi:hypothetical protein
MRHPVDAMSNGAVSRLHLRVPSGSLNMARARIEDALARVATDERLLLLRRLDLGRLSIRSPATNWADRTEERVAAESRRAVHGSAPGAAAADAVWFHSTEEAWSLLLRELALGRTPAAWFWRLAVPDWQGAPLGVWLAHVTRVAVRDTEVMARLAHALRPVFAAGIWAPVLAALAEAPPPAGRRGRPGRTPQPAAGFPDAVAPDWADHAARRGLARLDRGTRVAASAAIRAVSALDVRCDWIARLVLLPTAPELAGAPAALAAAAEAFAALLADDRNNLGTGSSDGTPLPAARPGNRATTRSAAELHVAEHFAVAASADAESRDVRKGPAVPGRDVATEGSAASSGAPPMAPAACAEPVLIPAEAFSPVAGLFLLIWPLIRLDLPAWLARHEAWMTEGFGRHLLQHIARRMRCPPDDPLLAILALDGRGNAAEEPDLEAPIPGTGKGMTAGGGPALDQSPASAMHDHARTAWRIGLDRWLRRTAGITLSEAVWRPGWILADGERVLVRFRLAAADIRLRRRALDIDPGWVPFLGFMVRYTYRDVPTTWPRPP